MTILIVSSTLNLTTIVASVHAESPSSPWDTIDTAIEYMRTHYVRYDEYREEYIWTFTDPFDIYMANAFISSVLEAEYIKDQNKDATIATIVARGLRLQNFDGTYTIIATSLDIADFVVKNFLVNEHFLRDTFEKVFQWFVDKNIFDVVTATNVKTQLVNFLIEKGATWLEYIKTPGFDWKTLTLDTSLADLTKYPTLVQVASVFRLAFRLIDLVNTFVEHVLVMYDIYVSETMLEIVKKWELGVEMVRAAIDFVGNTVAKYIAGAAATKGAVALAAGSALATGPFAIAIGVGAYVFIYHTVEGILERTIEWVRDDVLPLDLALYKRLGAAGLDVSPWRVKIIKIYDQRDDRFIPWGPGYEDGEDVCVWVKNVGVKTLNLRVTPTDVPSGWEVFDKEKWDLDNYRELQDFKPGDENSWYFAFQVKSGTVKREWPWHPWDFEWIPGVSPGRIEFTFEHDEITEWWDLFDWFPGGLKFLTKKFEIFHNDVDAYITVASGLHPARGETVERTISVTNMKSVPISFVLGVSFKDLLGEVKKYDPQISISPSGRVTLEPGQMETFTVTWTVPSDAPVGYYQVAVECWKQPYTQMYRDNLLWRFIFFVYELDILIPTSLHPARAGDPNAPNPIFVYITGLPPVREDPTFFIRIGAAETSYEIVDRLPVPVGYTLKVASPIQASEGKYDLEVWWFYGSLSSSDTETNAVEYTLAPPAEPIEKGLAWLRTRQYGDGSWRSSVGVTSLAVLAFLNAGYDETDTTVNKAINYILNNVKPDGSIYNSYPTYETSLAILVLVATRNNTYKTVIENAKSWLVNSQWDESCMWGSVSRDSWYYGGFGYGWSSRPDLSNSQFALLALDAAGLPKDHPLWTKAQVFLHRCQNINFSITLNIEGIEYTVQPYNLYGGYDGGFIYHPGVSLAGGQNSYGSMTSAGIWGLLLSGVPKTDARVVAAMNWVRNHYTWDTNPVLGWRWPYYYYLSMSKALTMYGEPLIDGHDWYQELYDKIVGMQIDAGPAQGYWSTTVENYDPDLTTAYAILSLQTRAIAPPVHRLSYLTFILRSNCHIRILDPEGNLVGYNHMTGLGENQIPHAAIYSGPFFEPQYIVIINPKAGTYKLELIGVSEGPYTLIIQGNYGEEVTDTFEYTGHIRLAELHGSQIIVTAIVGPIDIYATQPEPEEIMDNIPPTTTLDIGEPKYIGTMDNIYVSSATPFTLTAEDNLGGTGVSNTFYRIYNTTYDTDWLEYTAPFYLTSLSDGEYSIDYYSTDNAGNVEPTNTATIILDNTPPATTITIDEPKYVTDTIYVTPDTPFTLEATDCAGSGVYSIAYKIYNATYDTGWINYTNPFNLTSLSDGTYIIAYNSTDNVRNTETTHLINVTLFSWNYVFEDSYGRGTVLKINIAHKFFQFITPDKDYGIRNATYMRQCGRAIIIRHCDDELRLITIAVDTKLDFCVAIAYDIETCIRYFLIDKSGIEE